jgi:hypothetical protein
LKELQNAFRDLDASGVRFSNAGLRFVGQILQRKIAEFSTKAKYLSFNLHGN